MDWSSSLLPDPVVPAIMPCGPSRRKPTVTGAPVSSDPTATVNRSVAGSLHDRSTSGETAEPNPRSSTRPVGATLRDEPPRRPSITERRSARPASTPSTSTEPIGASGYSPIEVPTPLGSMSNTTASESGRSRR